MLNVAFPQMPGEQSLLKDRPVLFSSKHFAKCSAVFSGSFTVSILCAESVSIAAFMNYMSKLTFLLSYNFIIQVNRVSSTLHLLAFWRMIISSPSQFNRSTAPWTQITLSSIASLGEHLVDPASQMENDVTDAWL